MLHSDPFLLRHRAVTKLLASKEALSLAIRHCVSHRGYDYEYMSDEGSYPWGESTECKKVIKELQNTWLTREDADKARADVAAFETWTENDRLEFERVLVERTRGPEVIEERLSIHAAGSQNHLRVRAKGEAFPRKFVWEHLERIVRRHGHLIDDPETFLTRLRVKPLDPASRDRAIFYFHRKTPDEMKRHFEKKRARCRFAPWLGLGNPPVEKAGELGVRLFHLLEFAAMRDVELVDGTRVEIGPELTASLISWVTLNPNARTEKEAALLLSELTQSIQRRHGKKTAPKSGKNKSAHNEWFFKTIRDLLAPTLASRNQNASMSAVAAERLFEIATANGFERDAVKECLSDFYHFRRTPATDGFGIYPQVEFLLGQRVKKSRSRGGNLRGSRAHPGKLQRLFETLAAQLDGQTVPDYCTIEVARDLPRNSDQKKEREEMILENEKRRKALFAKFGLSDDAKGSKRRRVELFEQQRGLCPFTGESLGDDPLSDALEIEHLFPQTRGGLTINDNLVLTFRRINARKGDRTPREYAALENVEFTAMAAHSSAMRWSKSKRAIFCWDAPDEIPPFGNTTRVAQLAKQLWNEVADWIGINQIADPTHRENERSRRIGTPTGFFTAACRRSWDLPKKDRLDLTHHLVDAVILAHIPPREGQNYAQSGGIFYSSWNGEQRAAMLSALPLGPNVEAVSALVAVDAPECPVLRHRPSSPVCSLHDETQWRVRADGKLVARVKLPAKETMDAPGLRQRLIDTGIPLTYTRKDGSEAPLIPADSALEQWLCAKTDEPLRLLNGTPVRSIATVSKKGDFQTSIVGFHARRTAEGTLGGVKSINGRWDALELWRGWDARKKRWAYFKRLVPSPAVLSALRSVGVSWKKKARQPWKEGSPRTAESLQKSLTGALPPYSTPAIHPESGKPVIFRLGDTFLAGLSADRKLAAAGSPVSMRCWLYVSSVGKEKLELKCIQLRDVPTICVKTVESLALLAGLPPADDSSSYPRQRPPGSARPGGEADFRLE